MVEKLTVSFQKKLVKNNDKKIKPWWDNKILGPIAENRN
jgi:hypothetical protein